MFTKLFSKKNNENKTGIFEIKDGNLLELEVTPGNGSINSIIEYFGYATNLVHIVHTFDSKKLECLGFKVLSKKLVFALSKSKKTNISYSDVLKEVNNIDWDFEYSSLNVEDILNEAVDSENMNLDFFKSVLSDLHLVESSTYKSEKLGLYFYFENDILKSFNSSGFDNSATKWLKNLNPTMFEQMLKEAITYHDSELDAMEEVNKLSESILNIPHAAKNEFIELHKKSNGNVNFYNLLIAHYTQDCDLEEFLFMNKGRYTKLRENEFEVGKFIYEFSESNQLTNVLKK